MRIVETVEKVRIKNLSDEELEFKKVAVVSQTLKERTVPSTGYLLPGVFYSLARFFLKFKQQETNETKKTEGQYGGKVFKSEGSLSR